MLNNEPTLEQIEDYNDNESNEKRTIIKLVVLFLIAVGIIYGTIKYSFDGVNDYVGTPQNPGINTAQPF